MRWLLPKKGGDGGALGVAAIAHISLDYLFRELFPAWHGRLQLIVWSIFALIAISRVPSYKHWSAEYRAALPFVLSLLFLLSAFFFEILSVRFVSTVLGGNWHRTTPPLPDTGQWLLLALNEKLPQTIVEMLRAHVVALEHYLMLFIMLGFSVLFDSVKAPGLGLAARYLFTLAIGRILRTITFISTIVPSARPWCASSRYDMPEYPHPWAQKYYVPYASDAGGAIRQLLRRDIAYADVGEFPSEYRPDWGAMSFLVDYLRPSPSEGTAWYHVLKRASGGCNDLIYSGHMILAVLTAMAWTEAYGGYSSGLIWILVLHSAQREIRERHHYSVDCIVAIYVGILLWKMTGCIWSAAGKTTVTTSKLEKVQNRLLQAAKDGDMDEVRELLQQADQSAGNQTDKNDQVNWLFPFLIVGSTLTMVGLAFAFTSDG